MWSEVNWPCKQFAKYFIYFFQIWNNYFTIRSIRIILINQLIQKHFLLIYFMHWILIINLFKFKQIYKYCQFIHFIKINDQILIALNINNKKKIISGQHKVQCSEEWMKVAIAVPDNYQDSHQIYLEGMKGYPNPSCQPEIKDSLAQFSLSLKDIYECGVTRVVNKLTVWKSSLL